MELPGGGAAGELVLSSTYLASVDARAARRGLHGQTHAHLVLDNGKEVIHAQACGDRVELFGGADTGLKCCVYLEDAAAERGSSSKADPGRLLCVALAQPAASSLEVWIAVSRGSSIQVWRSLPTASGRRDWSIHSSILLTSEGATSSVTALAAHRNVVAVGGDRFIGIYHLADGERTWRRAWTSPIPTGKSAGSLCFSPDGSLLSARLQRGRQVTVWRIPVPLAPQRTTGPWKVRVVDRLVLPDQIKELQWRRPPGEQNADGHVSTSSLFHALIVKTTDNTHRIYATVLDQPDRFRLWYVVSGGTFGAPADAQKERQGSESIAYLNAGDFVSACRNTVHQLQIELQKRELGVSADDAMQAGPAAADREADVLKTRIKRLEHFSEDTPDMFVRARWDRSVDILGVANVDRKPPTLIQSYTAVKIRHPDSRLVEALSQATHSVFYPLLESAASRHIRSACLATVAKDGRRSCSVVRLDRLFDGDSAGLADPELHALTQSGMRDAIGHVLGVAASVRQDEVIVRCSDGFQVWRIQAGRLHETRRAWQVSTASVDHAAQQGDSLAIATGRTITILAGDNTASRSMTCDDTILALSALAPAEFIAVLANGAAQVLSAAVDGASSTSSSVMWPKPLAAAAFTIGADDAVCAIVDTGGEAAVLRLDKTAAAWNTLATWPHPNRDPSPPILALSGDGKIAIGYGARLHVLDPRSRQFACGVEQVSLAGSILTSLAWNRGSVMLAAGQGRKITLFARARVSATRMEWTPVASVRSEAFAPAQSPTTLAFTSSDQLVIAAEATLRAFSPVVVGTAAGKETRPLAAIFATRQGLLPQYHPCFLRQALLAGHLAVVVQILVRLSDELARAPTDGSEPLIVEPLPAETFWQSGSADAGASAEALQRLLERSVPGMTDEDTSEVRSLVRTVSVAAAADGALDANAVRFLIGVAADANEPCGLDNMLWAHYSDSQDMLLQHVQSSATEGKLAWARARALGIFLWTRSAQALETMTDTVARMQYLAGDDRDPVTASLFYLAAGKHKMVVNLWRQAVSHPEQRKMIQFLSNDFTLERWKAAAQKNAFALLSQRRFNFAVSFFLLGDGLKDAVNVCYKHLDDLQLAIALCRIKEGGDDGPVLRDLVLTRVLPQAFAAGDRWLAIWCFEILKRPDLAVRTATAPLDIMRDDADVKDVLPEGIQLASGAEDGGNDAGHFGLVVLYGELKKRHPAFALPVDKESRFILYANRLLGSLGCPELGLALLRNWRFEPPAVRRGETMLVEKASAGEPEGQPQVEQDTALALFDGGEVTLTALQPQDAGATAALPRKGVSNLMKQTATDQQEQAAAAFDFSSFGF